MAMILAALKIAGWLRLFLGRGHTIGEYNRCRHYGILENIIFASGARHGQAGIVRERLLASS